MTREEAIMELNRFSGTIRLRLSANFWESLNIAIKALEQEPSEDAISRRAVLDTLDKMDSVLDENRTVETYKELLIACYNDLPPVTPVRKEERWIPCSERLPEEGKPVLVSGYNTYGKEVTIASYQGEQYGFTCGLVSAWMRLPEPYKAEMEGGVCKGCHYNDGEVHAECVVCDKAEMESE